MVPDADFNSEVPDADFNSEVPDADFKIEIGNSFFITDLVRTKYMLYRFSFFFGVSFPWKYRLPLKAHNQTSILFQQQIKGLQRLIFFFFFLFFLLGQPMLSQRSRARRQCVRARIHPADVAAALAAQIKQSIR